ncbi:MAG: HAD-IB family phosphatase [Opitutales bacterium]
MRKLILFDCDSTLSRIEGVDEMARLRGAEVYRQIEEMTRLAMEGSISLDAIFGRRLELVQPTRQETEAIGQAYIDTVEPAARELMAELKRSGWDVAIVSGGYRQAIRPLADFLGIDRVEAVDLFFLEDGSYESYDRDYPTTRNGGKREVAESLRRESSYDRTVMVGDGVSDLEAKPVVDLFIGYGGFAEREAVKREADYFVFSLAEILDLIESSAGRGTR